MNLFLYDFISKQGGKATKTKRVTECEREGKDVSEKKCELMNKENIFEYGRWQESIKPVDSSTDE